MTAISRWAATHRKAIIGYTGLAATIALAVTGPGSPWYPVIVAAAAALGVHGVGNAEAKPAPKPKREPWPGPQNVTVRPPTTPRRPDAPH